jgi:hypothetical protein
MTKLDRLLIIAIALGVAFLIGFLVPVPRL